MPTGPEKRPARASSGHQGSSGPESHCMPPPCHWHPRPLTKEAPGPQLSPAPDAGKASLSTGVAQNLGIKMREWPGPSAFLALGWGLGQSSGTQPLVALRCSTSDLIPRGLPSWGRLP